MHSSLCFYPFSNAFQMHSGSCVLWGCSPPPAILPRSPHLCQNGGLSILSSTEKQRKVGLVGRTVLLLSVKNSRWKRKYEIVCCRDATAISFVAIVRGKVFAHYHTVAEKHHSSMRNWLFGLPGWILCEQSRDVRENDEHAVGFAMHLSGLFSLG
jgi:hypothetical protein